jgi:hypothetical protein
VAARPGGSGPHRCTQQESATTVNNLAGYALRCSDTLRSGGGCAVVRGTSEHSVVDGRTPGRPVVEIVRANLGVLLETKLQAPRVRREWVDRPALVRALDDCESRLILVDAPAGYGKTTLLAQWGYAAAASRPFAWISLDRGDDDPARLWQHVVGSLQRAFPSLRAAEILRPLQRQVPDAEEALARLVNELTSLAAPVVIVLDDYHVIRERRCHEQLEFLLRCLPPAPRSC